MNVLSYFNADNLRLGATESSISALQHETKWTLPADYIEFLKISNGVEGFLVNKDSSDNDSYIQIWSAEEVVESLSWYADEPFASEFIVIGSNGGGVIYGIDIRRNQLDHPRYMSFDAISVSWEEVLSIHDSFVSLLKYLTHSE